MKIAKEFSRFAKDYNQNNIIQAEVAKKLVDYLNLKNYDKILDIGCGRGEVCKNLDINLINFTHFCGVDMAIGMLDLHPKKDNITLINGDFSTAETFSKLPYPQYDIILSSSALQWSQNLDITLYNISKLSNEFYFSIFTSGTFSSLHKFANISSPIYSESYLRDKIDKYFNAKYEVVKYKLYFDTVYEMLRYIKESGISGGKAKLTFKEIKRVISEYPLNYLEFEVIFIKAISKV
ncbi:putative methyl transferase [hydrothermal vent metagenome]|uniref:Putative methyl transferase n=1 Tax=hydrothermal vent metagenome TaxID=652676 RepID=A0A1W1CBQ7_9ZZZZ